jgi:hypothetical protein
LGGTQKQHAYYLRAAGPESRRPRDVTEWDNVRKHPVKEPCVVRTESIGQLRQVSIDEAATRQYQRRDVLLAGARRRRKRFAILAIADIFAAKPGIRLFPCVSEMSGKRRAHDRSWLDLEVEGSEFQDTRLRHRVAILLEKLWDSMRQTIPFACQDWAPTTATYRFLSNDRVGENDILSVHFQASAEQVKVTDGPVLILQDVTTISYQRERPEFIDYTGKTTLRTGKKGVGPQKPLTQCGILMLSSLVLTADGLPRGPGCDEILDEKTVQGRF